MRMPTGRPRSGVCATSVQARHRQPAGRLQLRWLALGMMAGGSQRPPAPVPGHPACATPPKSKPRRILPRESAHRPPRRRTGRLPVCRRGQAGSRCPSAPAHTGDLRDESPYDLAESVREQVDARHRHPKSGMAPNPGPPPISSPGQRRWRSAHSSATRGR